MFLEYLAPALICSAAAFLAAFAACLVYGIKSRRAARNLDLFAGKSDKIKRCSIHNMQSIETRVFKTGSVPLKNIWNRYKADSDYLFGGESAPEPGAYFTYTDVFALPNREGLLSVLWGLLPVFAFLALISPASILFFSGEDITPERVRAMLGASSLGLVFAAILFAAAWAYIRGVRSANEVALFGFNRSLSSLLPIINQSTQAALLLQASRQNTEAFVNTAKVIAEKIDDFTVNGITPVVSDAFQRAIAKHLAPGINDMGKSLRELSETVVRRQESGMRELADSFAEKLGGSLSEQSRSLAADMETLGAELRSMQSGLLSAASSLNESIEENRSVLREAAEVSRETAGHQEAAIRSTGDLAEALTRTEQIISALSERNDEVFSRLVSSSDQIKTSQEQLAAQLTALETVTKSTAEYMSGSAEAITSAVSSLIASAEETGTRTNALISEKLTSILSETAALNAETYNKVAEAVQALIDKTGQTADAGYERVSNKLAEILAETNALNADTYNKVAEAVHALIDKTGQTTDAGYERVSNKLAGILTETNASNAETYTKVADAVQALIDKTGQTADAGYERVSNKLAEILTETNASNAETYERVSRIAESVASGAGEAVDAVFSRYSDHMVSVLDETIRTNNETTLKLSATMESLSQAGSEQYEKAARAAAKLLEDVVVEMNKAMDGVGHEIAESITNASLGSAEIVDRLAERTMRLKEDYDTYFRRVEEQNTANLTEMEFRVQNVFSRFSDEANVVMERLESSISSAMNLFEGNTTDLLRSLEEQSRSIGLYAKDINIDVASLSESLRESVGIFTEHLKNSTKATFAEFDSGLAEVSARLANTVESIREAVENLPGAISPRN